MNVLKLLEYIGEREKAVRGLYIPAEAMYSQGKSEGELMAYGIIRSKINELQLAEAAEPSDLKVLIDPDPPEPPLRLLTIASGYESDSFHRRMQDIIQEHSLTEDDILSIHPPAFKGDTYKMYFWLSPT